MARGYKRFTTLSDGGVRKRLAASAAVAALVASAAGCGSSAGVASQTGSTATTAAHTCPPAWAAGWQRWTNRIGAGVYCPIFFPPPITAEIDGPWNTAKAPVKEWQLGFAWLE